MPSFTTLQVELAVLGATDEGVPFGRGEEQHVPLGVAGIAHGDAGIEQGDLDGGGTRRPGRGAAAPHGVGQVSLELLHAHSLPTGATGRKGRNRYVYRGQSTSSLPFGPTASAFSSSIQMPSLAR